MRLIDADALPCLVAPYGELLYKIKEAIQNAPTIETIHGYRIDHLVFIASVMAEEGLSPNRVVNIMENAGMIVDMVLKEQKRIMDDEIEKWIRREEDPHETERT